MNIVRADGDKMNQQIPNGNLLSRKYGFETKYLISTAWSCQEKCQARLKSTGSSPHPNNSTTIALRAYPSSNSCHHHYPIPSCPSAFQLNWPHPLLTCRGSRVSLSTSPPDHRVSPSPAGRQPHLSKVLNFKPNHQTSHHPSRPPARPPLLANRTASDSFPLSHLTYLPANYAQKLKPAPQPTTLEYIKPDRRFYPIETTP
ncbi:hypothetical protein PGTUg99_002586 [Puccinia graminis f. sp. tritici]|uniref:DUF7872 domain-containing protein n=1 Tax=Puccinia graminis f. sp. tritici TaxID=56615 RepID=A0A5B0SB81_PUCGR|nr:hypothetical protein PGTUg99_002586 [Puccinia graminis f. sp. tritici]